MSDLEREELVTRALSMSQEERTIVLNSFPVEELIEVIYQKYSDMKNRYEAVKSIFDTTPIIGGN